tara:strand:- start:6975 stop:7655 length:681 start_codon:yes stop_codon:yes gene_type:complete
MIEIDFVFLILNCKKYIYKSDIQKKLWLHKLPPNIKYLHVIGDKTLCNEKDYVFDMSNNKLYINTLDDYVSLPDKVISAIAAINENFKYKYILKSDDDQKLINETYFLQVIDTLNKNNNYHYGGGICPMTKDIISNYWAYHASIGIDNGLPKNIFLKKTVYCAGRFYFLSYEVTNELIKKRNEIKKHIIEDHCIGLYIPEKYKINLLNINVNEIFVDVVPPQKINF